MPSHILFFPEACLELPCSSNDLLQALNLGLRKNLPCWLIPNGCHGPSFLEWWFQYIPIIELLEDGLKPPIRVLLTWKAHLWGSRCLVWDKWFKMAVWSDILCLAVHVQVGLERREVLHFQPIALQLCHGKVKKAWRTSFTAEKTWGSQKPRKCVKRWPSRVIPPGEILRVSVRDSVKPWSMRRHIKTWWIWYNMMNHEDNEWRWLILLAYWHTVGLQRW